MIIFLDLDGVTHHKHFSGEAEMFDDENMDNLEKILDEFPEAEIVLSTYQRHSEVGRNAIKEGLSEKILDRVVGYTPVLPYPYLGGEGEMPDGLVEMEAQLWLKENDMEDSPWIAINDRENLFFENAPLYVTDGEKGLVEIDVAPIIELIKQEQQRPIEEIHAQKELSDAEFKERYRMQIFEGQEFSAPEF